MMVIVIIPSQENVEVNPHRGQARRRKQKKLTVSNTETDRIDD